MADYTSSQQIAAYLGTTLTTEQLQQADVVAHAITDWIDHRTGRTWQQLGAIVDEINDVIGTSVYLHHAPVASVEAVDVLDENLFPPTWQTLDPSQYTLIDPQAGVLQLVGGYAGDAVRVDYTTDQTQPPSDLAYAATVLAADTMTVTLHPESAGVSSIAVGQNDISITYADAGTGGASSAVSLAVRVVDAYRRVVLA
jgi:hypothetical protein